jgi:hypothetical protein
VLITDVLAATSNPDDTTFSVPILVGAAALGVGWILLFVAVAARRRPHGIRSGPATQDLPPVPPVVAPGWGKHPAFATFLAVLWGAAAVAALYGLRSLAQSAADPITATDPLFDRDQLDWIGRGALLLMIPVALVLLWAIFLLVRAVPDFWRTRTATGELVCARRRSQISQLNNLNDPRYWYYLALDDGTRSRIRSWRVRRNLYDAHSQGETVAAMFTANLGYVRELRPPSAARST